MEVFVHPIDCTLDLIEAWDCWDFVLRGSSHQFADFSWLFRATSLLGLQIRVVVRCCVGVVNETNTFLEQSSDIAAFF